MGCDKLSHKLLDLGFFSALGTTERSAGQPDGFLVKRGTPNTFDYNNGVVVVYDEMGRPWLKPGPGGVLVEEIHEIRNEYSLTIGAHVPHSNDGGRFAHEILPTL